MKVLYLLHDFPIISETFILNEILDHLSTGLDVRVFSMGLSPSSEWAKALLLGSLAGRVSFLGIHAPKRSSQHLLQNLFAIATSLRTPSLMMRALLKRDARLLRASSNIREFKADIIHAHFSHMGILASRLRSCGKISGMIVTTVHGFDISKGNFGSSHRYKKDMSSGSDLVITVNELWRESLINSGCDSGKILVNHLGVDTARLLPKQSRNNAMATFCSVGRFIEKKGHRYSILAFDELRKRNPDHPCKLKIIGDGPLLSETRALVRELGRSEEIELLGAMPHDEALMYIRDADFFLLPSIISADGNMEGIPISLMEAMSFAKPTISTVHSGIPELICTEEDGILVGEGDTIALSYAMERILLDERLARKLGSAARIKTTQHFDLKIQGRKLRTLYTDLLAKHQ